VIRRLAVLAACFKDAGTGDFAIDLLQPEAIPPPFAIDRNNLVTCMVTKFPVVRKKW